jgi:hypothetical protein
MWFLDSPTERRSLVLQGRAQNPGKYMHQNGCMYRAADSRQHSWSLAFVSVTVGLNITEWRSRDGGDYFVLSGCVSFAVSFQHAQAFMPGTLCIDACFAV